MSFPSENGAFLLFITVKQTPIITVYLLPAKFQVKVLSRAKSRFITTTFKSKQSKLQKFFLVKFVQKMSGEEATPVAESKTFPELSGGSSTTESSSPISPERLFETTRSRSKKSASQALAIPGGKTSPKSPETDMSASYHEIFDSQMLLPAGKDNDFQRPEDDEEENHGEDRLAPLLCCDNNTASTTEYLTSKLVEDSLKWQKECDKDFTSSPKESPVRKRPDNLSVEQLRSLSLDAKAHPQHLDPSVIEDVERHARYLAACVDSMVENLSGVLHSGSALTVDTLETYRDGVCKTCDEVDNNIKSMYQLMAKVEELNKSMAPAYQIGEEVKELKKLLDTYESLT